MNKSAAEKLAQELIGPVPVPRKSLTKGGLTGITLFFIFEYISVINSNIPRVPVSWLMMAAAIMVETTLFFRIFRFLSQPRRNDLFFILRLSHAMRTTVALTAARQAHRAFIPFTAAVLAVSAAFEFLLIHERSPMVLLVVPVAGLSAMVIIERVYNTIIARGGIPCSRHDRFDDETAVYKGSFFRKLIAKISVTLARRISSMAPHGIRIIVMRNLLYLLRGEPVLSALITIAAPAVIFPLILLLNNLLSPFVTLFALVALFIMNFHFASELADASGNLPQYHWYRFTPGQLLRGNFMTLALPAIPLVIVVFATLVPTMTTLYGCIRLLGFFIAIAVTLLIGCHCCTVPGNNDSGAQVAIPVFALIAIGNFIPWAGALFCAAAAAIIVLVDWDIFKGKE